MAALFGRDVHARIAFGLSLNDLNVFVLATEIQSDALVLVSATEGTVSFIHHIIFLLYPSTLGPERQRLAEIKLLLERILTVFTT